LFGLWVKKDLYQKKNTMSKNMMIHIVPKKNKFRLLAPKQKKNKERRLFYFEN
jgi:hypothetical protein